MPGAITIHADDEDGNSFEITLKKTGPDTGFIELKKVNQPIDDHSFNVLNIRANADGTKIVCKAAVIFNPVVTCLISHSQPSSPTVEVDVGSLFLHHVDKFEITQIDFNNLTKFVVDAGFPH